MSADELLDRDDLAEILQLHVAADELEADDLSVGQSVATLGGTITIVSASGGPGIDTDADGSADARITTTDVGAPNGVVHTISSVLLPSGG